MSAVLANKKKVASSSTLNFLKKNVLSVTDLTRSNKLSEILNIYAGKETSEIFIIQNNKNRNAIGVLVDLEYYERLLRLQEAVEQVTDDYMYQLALARQHEKTDLSLGEVVELEDYNLDDLIAGLGEIEIDEE